MTKRIYLDTNHWIKLAPKIIDHIKKWQKDVFLVGFKAETNLSKKKLEESARKKMKEVKADLIIANDIGIKYQKNPDFNEIILVNSGKAILSGWKRKEKLAKIIRKKLEKLIANLRKRIPSKKY